MQNRNSQTHKEGGSTGNHRMQQNLIHTLTPQNTYWKKKIFTSKFLAVYWPKLPVNWRIISKFFWHAALVCLSLAWSPWCVLGGGGRGRHHTDTLASKKTTNQAPLQRKREYKKTPFLILDRKLLHFVTNVTHNQSKYTRWLILGVVSQTWSQPKTKRIFRRNVRRLYYQKRLLSRLNKYCIKPYTLTSSKMSACCMTAYHGTCRSL